MTREEIEAGKTEKGGYTKAQLAAWGISWPPPKGWKEMLLSGQPLDQMTRVPTPNVIRPNEDAHELLRKVVLAVVNAGHASDLYEFPDVIAYFAREPRG